MLTRLLNRAIPYLLLTTLSGLALGCDSNESDDEAGAIVIGGNFEITGDLPEVGAASRNAAEMFVDETNAGGGVEIDGATYTLELIVADNRGSADQSVVVANELITEDSVHVMVGPNLSSSAIPTGAGANALQTVMISPWSTNPNTTLNRPWVFRAPYVDSFQGPVLANFAAEQYNATSACIMHDPNNAYPHGIAQSFRAAWVATHGAGSVAAEESYDPDVADHSEELGRIIAADCDFLFLPQYSNEVPQIVAQAHDLGLDAPVLGSDSWGSSELLDDCGAECEGYFFSAHYIANGATGETQAFIESYEAEFGGTPSDVAALTWDAMHLVVEALQDCGEITGDLGRDRTCVRDAMAAIEDFDGITGNMSFDDQGDPIKCAQIVQIDNGEFNAFGSACP